VKYFVIRQSIDNQIKRVLLRLSLQQVIAGYCGIVESEVNYLTDAKRDSSVTKNVPSKRQLYARPGGRSVIKTLPSE